MWECLREPVISVAAREVQLNKVAHPQVAEGLKTRRYGPVNARLGGGLSQLDLLPEK